MKMPKMKHCLQAFFSIYAGLIEPAISRPGIDLCGATRDPPKEIKNLNSSNCIRPSPRSSAEERMKKKIRTDLMESISTDVDVNRRAGQVKVYPGKERFPILKGEFFLSLISLHEWLNGNICLFSFTFEWCQSKFLNLSTH
jgi:hypothetical protein